MAEQREQGEKETMPDFFRWLIRRTILFFLIIMVAGYISKGIRALFF